MKKNIFFIFYFLFQLNLAAQIVLEEEPKRLYYERLGRVKKFKDMKDFRDVFHYNKLLLGKDRISGNISFNTGRVVVDDGQKKHNEARNAIGFFFRVRFFEQFSFNTTLYMDFNPKASAKWTSNYTYSIARYNWKPNKFNYGYENYVNNRYSDDLKAMGEKFLEGYYFISYSHTLSEKAAQKIKLDSTTNVKFTYFTRYSIKYKDANEVMHGGIFSGKPSIGGGVRFTIFWNIYVETAVYYYFEPFIQKQQPWDPDYSYGFGYFDWRSFRWSLTYGNWAVNRFPGRKTHYPYYGFLDGNFRFVINWMW